MNILHHLESKGNGFTFQLQNKLALDTHTIKVSGFFFHFRDLQK